MAHLAGMDPADGIYFIVAGRIRLSATDLRGKQAILGLLGANEVFGQQCLMLGRKTRVMTAEAVAATELVIVQCSNCRRRVCLGHAIESENPEKMLCSYCASGSGRHG